MFSGFHDAVSSLTHLFTAGWAVFATLVLLRLTHGQGAGRWAVGMFGLSMILLYTASGTFHGLVYLSDATSGPSRARAVRDLWVFQRLDKSAIFLLIAGSNVPCAVYLLRGWWRRACLGGMVILAVAGIAAQWLLPALPEDGLVGIYVAMGLVGMAPLRLYWEAVGWTGMRVVAMMAGWYLLGAAAEVLRWPTLVPGWFGPHEVLHVADVAGTLTHFGFVVRFLIPRVPAGVGPPEARP